jgi:anaerobic carbon-monoxide dehydrogenase iron sulfur subunit
MIRIDASRCTGCRCCEAACAFHHTGSGGRILSRIRVVNLYELGVDAPVVCQQCAERYCLACPDEALTLGSLGQVVVSPTLCSQCGACTRSCPIGAIEAVNGIAFVCDLCGGQPRCVEACTQGAIAFAAGSGGVASLAPFKAGSERLAPSRKRAIFVRTLGQALRAAWEVTRG